jgi:cob(I)alamin adenosyltransferase
MSIRIYTKTGDSGQTSLLGGQRVPKHHLRIEAYGNTDELNAHIGLLRDLQQGNETALALIRIQNQLFVIGSHLAMAPGKVSFKLPELNPQEIR